MKLAVMQPYFFPYLGYFSLIDSVDKFIIFDDVNFIKRGWINRNQFLGANGVFTYSIPLKKASQNKAINEHQISDIEDLTNHFFKALAHSYKKAPQYRQVMSFLESAFSTPPDNLANLLSHLLVSTAEFLEIDTEFSLSSAIPRMESLNGQNQIISICRTHNATDYHNAIGGMSLYDGAEFLRSGLKLKFIKYNGIPYEQVRKGYAKNLSVIDAMMHLDKKRLKENIRAYEVING